MNILEIKDLEKYDKAGSPVLDGVTFDVKEGGITSLVGPQACGKSLLLQILAGLVQPDKGVVKRFGEEEGGVIDGNSIPINLRNDLKLIFQESALFPWMRVGENLMFGLLNRGLSKEKAKKQANAWLSKVGLKDFFNEFPGQLSGGMQRRASMVMILITEPKLILCDEIFGGLDFMTRRVLSDDFLYQCHRQKVSVLYVTHAIEEAVYMAERLYVMSDVPSKIVKKYDINLPKKRWEHPELRLEREYIDTVEDARSKYMEVAQKIANR
jgi:ABC-type nitrate/sulfonate/bicarbonate transport system ATPase subunit